MEEVLPALSAGVISTVVCNPLDVIRVNYQLNKKIKTDFKFLYRGINYGIVAIPSFWVIYFPLYKKLKNDLPSSVSAYLSCCSASAVSTPFWVLRQKAYTGIKHDWKSEKLSSYYKGLLPTFLINLSFVIQMPIYEYLKTKVENNTFNIFLITSISKTIATSILYPLDTIRVKIRNGDLIKNIKITEYYKGISIYLVRSIPYHATVFCTYEYVKKIIS